MEESSGAYYALKLAQVHLENKLKSIEQYKAKSDRELDSCKQVVSSLRAENEELKERIKAGAKEYSKLFEKCRILKNQQLNYDMNNVYHDLNGDVLNLRKDFNFKSNINQRLFMNQRQQNQQNYRHSTPAEDLDSEENDSAIQDKTNTTNNTSQSVRASSTDIENTLLDALLGSSFPWNDDFNKNQLNKKVLNVQQQLCKMGMSSSSPFEALDDEANIVSNAKATGTTTTQPTISKVHAQTTGDLMSDDGLINLNAVVAENKSSRTQEATASASNIQNECDDDVFCKS